MYEKQGVPKGSILGPLLFIILINNLPNSTRSSAVLFADGTSVVCSAKDTESLKIIWFSENGLKVNIDKTVSIFHLLFVSVDATSWVKC